MNYIGVRFSKRDNKFRSGIKYNNKERHLGYFNTAEEAATKYNLYSNKYFGRKGKLNDIENKCVINHQEYKIKDNTVEFKIYSIKYGNQIVIIDKEDWNRVKQHRWTISALGYVVSRINKKVIYLHRFILKLSTFAKKVDHRFHNKLDNRRINLRIATSRQNCNNSRKTLRKTSSKYKGVYWEKRRLHFVAQITINNKKIYIGSFNSETDAANAFNEAAVKYHKEFACLNSIPETK